MYKEKYLKYKQKYLQLKKIGGMNKQTKQKIDEGINKIETDNKIKEIKEYYKKIIRLNNKNNSNKILININLNQYFNLRYKYERDAIDNSEEIIELMSYINQLIIINKIYNLKINKIKMRINKNVIDKFTDKIHIDFNNIKTLNIYLHNHIFEDKSLSFNNTNYIDIKNRYNNYNFIEYANDDDGDKIILTNNLIKNDDKFLNIYITEINNKEIFKEIIEIIKITMVNIENIIITADSHGVVNDDNLFYLFKNNNEQISIKEIFLQFINFKYLTNIIFLADICRSCGSIDSYEDYTLNEKLDKINITVITPHKNNIKVIEILENTTHGYFIEVFIRYNLNILIENLNNFNSFKLIFNIVNILFDINLENINIYKLIKSTFDDDLDLINDDKGIEDLDDQLDNQLVNSNTEYCLNEICLEKLNRFTHNELILHKFYNHKNIYFIKYINNYEIDIEFLFYFLFNPYIIEKNYKIITEENTFTDKTNSFLLNSLFSKNLFYFRGLINKGNIDILDDSDKLEIILNKLGNKSIDITSSKKTVKEILILFCKRIFGIYMNKSMRDNFKEFNSEIFDYLDITTCKNTDIFQRTLTKEKI